MENYLDLSVRTRYASPTKRSGERERKIYVPFFPLASCSDHLLSNFNFLDANEHVRVFSSLFVLFSICYSCPAALAGRQCRCFAVAFVRATAVVRHRVKGK